MSTHPCKVEAARQSDPRENLLLLALSESDWDQVRPLLELVQVERGKLLSESGRVASYVYFPTTAIVSMQCMTEDGNCCEVAVVGKDGVVGISLFMGGDSTPSQALVQSAGECYRLRASEVRRDVDAGGPMLHMLLKYTQDFIAQVAQTAACNRYHSIDQLLCRRLLLGLDRGPSDALAMTHELLASLLGVRREGISAAASRLQQAGVIRYSRGRIDVLDREQLVQRMGSSLGGTGASSGFKPLHAN
jgi:CRP-like cAMP-binding protein